MKAFITFKSELTATISYTDIEISDESITAYNYGNLVFYASLERIESFIRTEAD